MAYSVTTGLTVVARITYVVCATTVETRIKWLAPNHSGWGVEVEVINGLEIESVKFFRDGDSLTQEEVYEMGFRKGQLAKWTSGW